MTYEHLTVDSGGRELVPFARRRLAALRAAGIEYGEQTFNVGGSTVRVRVSGEHDHIYTSGGVMMTIVIELAGTDGKLVVRTKPKGNKTGKWSVVTSPSFANVKYLYPLGLQAAYLVRISGGRYFLVSQRSSGGAGSTAGGGTIYCDFVYPSGVCKLGPAAPWTGITSPFSGDMSTVYILAEPGGGAIALTAHDHTAGTRSGINWKVSRLDFGGAAFTAESDLPSIRGTLAPYGDDIVTAMSDPAYIGGVDSGGVFWPHGSSEAARTLPIVAKRWTYLRVSFLRSGVSGWSLVNIAGTLLDPFMTAVTTDNFVTFTEHVLPNSFVLPQGSATYTNSGMGPYPTQPVDPVAGLGTLYIGGGKVIHSFRRVHPGSQTHGWMQDTRVELFIYDPATNARTPFEAPYKDSWTLNWQNYFNFQCYGDGCLIGVNHQDSSGGAAVVIRTEAIGSGWTEVPVSNIIDSLGNPVTVDLKYYFRVFIVSDKTATKPAELASLMHVVGQGWWEFRSTDYGATWLKVALVTMDLGYIDSLFGASIDWISTNRDVSLDII